MQVFALEDGNNGQLMIYLPDALAEAQKSGLLAKKGAKAPGEVAADVAAASAAGAGGSGAQEYAIRGSKGGAALRLEALDAANTPNPAAHVKNMLGWNRKALRVTLLTVSPAEQIAAAEALCALAAKKWAGKTATPAAGKPPAAKS
jgi:hypothetical protein